MVIRQCVTCQREDDKAPLSEVTIAVGAEGEEIVTPHHGGCSVLAVADLAFA